MPDITPTRKQLLGFTALSDSGFLKQEDGEYNWLQNIRGWGGAGRKRKGIETLTSFTSGIMGVFDMKIAGDAEVADRILVFTQDGTMWSFSRFEFTTLFDFLFSATGKLYLQSPDSTWWDITPTSGGLINPTGVSYAGATISTDQIIPTNATYGFAYSGKSQRMQVNDFSEIVMTEYPVVSGSTIYNGTVAFVDGVGPVFQTSTNRAFRVTIDNVGILNITEL